MGFLTILATLFIPLSFLATLFDMNVKEFVNPPSIRFYWEIGIPVSVGVFFIAWLFRRYGSARKTRHA